MKISIIGAGMVGSTVARNHSRSMSNIDEIVLLDIKDKLAEGKAIDINQCEPRNKIIGCTNDYSKTKNSDIVIITSGTNIQSHTAQIWKNLNNGSVNVSFKLWSEATLVRDGTVSGILLCV